MSDEQTTRTEQTAHTEQATRSAEAEAPPEPRKHRKHPHVVKAIVVPSIAVFVVIYLLSGVCIVKPEQVALVTRFGKLRPMPLPPGTHYRLPYPIDKVIYVKPNEVKTVSVGKQDFPEDEGEIETYYVETGLGREFLTGDENIVHLTLNIQYKISEPASFLFNTAGSARLVRVATEVALADVVARIRVDELITSGKQWVLAQVRDKAQELLDDLGVGVSVMSANFENVAPPTEVSDAFKDVASALEDRDRFINEANGEYSAAVPEAMGEAERTIQEAMALKESTVNRARGEADRFLTTLDGFRTAGSDDVSRLRLYIDAMEEVLPRLRKYIVETDSTEDSSER